MWVPGAVTPVEAQRLAPDAHTVAAWESQPWDEGDGSTLPAMASLILPGAGQWMLGQRRWIGYAALEAAGWLLFLDRRRDGHRLRDRYRGLAWEAARARFGGIRVDGDFDYYEDLIDFDRSGTFDVDALTPGIQPETDPSTFNGQVWELARGLFFPAGQPDPTPGSPEYERALRFYEERSYGDAFLWDWAGEEASQVEFGSLIHESDEALRRATLLLGIVGANHALSAVDALVSARLSAAGAGSVESSLILLPVPARPGVGFLVRWTP